jgi:beta-phosphoglucomutase-like phosphatase (HAD superfamily)
LAQSSIYGVGLATGGWSESARCKMRSAGMRFDDFPAASADDAIARVSIMQIALDRLIASRNDRQPDSVVYIGDGIWDARACRELGFPFIGIAAGDSGVKLRAAGASAVFADYADLDQFCAALTAAREPVEMR